MRLAELAQIQKGVAAVTQAQAKAVGHVRAGLPFDQINADGDSLVVIRDRLGKLAKIPKGNAAIIQAANEVGDQAP